MTHCYICNSSNIFFLDSFFRGGDIYKCRNCDNAVTIPKPIFDYKQTEKFMFKESDYKEAKSYVRPALNFIKSFISSGKLLDVGSGVGALIDEANMIGFRAEGLEPSLPAVKLCIKNGLKVKRGFLENARYVENTFDIVVLSHVLEHVPDPNKFLSKVHKILRKNGFVFLCQTNYTGTIPKILRKYWEGWVTSQHFVHFSPKGIKFILKKNKFDVVKISLIESGYKLLWRWGGFGKIANNLYYSMNYILSKILKPFNFKGDQMYILAVKS